MNWFACKFCPCVFVCEDDLKAHLAAFGSGDEHKRRFKSVHNSVEYGGDDGEGHRRGWMKSKNGDGEWCWADTEPKLSIQVKQNGKVVLGGFEVSIDKTGTYLHRRAAQF